MLAVQLSTHIQQAPMRALDDLSRDIWKALTSGLIAENEAQDLAAAIQERRGAHRPGTLSGTPSGTPPGTPLGMAPGTAVGASGEPSAKPPRAWSYFPAKRPQRTPNKAQSLERRRTLAATGPLPPSLACRFTTGELAVLKIVADEVSAKGTCVLSIPEIAARSGVGLTKARMALRIAASLGLVVISERRVPYQPNLTNVVRIISREWNAWLSKRKPHAPASRLQRVPDQGCKDLQSTAAALRHEGEGSFLRRPRIPRVYGKSGRRPF